MDPVTGGGGGGGYSYPDSASSSPRSRSADSYDEPFPSSNSNSSSKVRLMCSYGGRIVPRPTDKSLTYLGGDTRFLLLDRHSSLSDLLSKLLSSISTSTTTATNKSSSNYNRNTDLSTASFVIKYQLPNEDLDSLITLSSDEDLDNMIEEYDRINSSAAAAKSSRIRLFLFPTGKAESATSSSIGSLLDDSKSETWFVDALNGAMAVRADAGSGSADLLGLEAGGDQTDADRGMMRPDSSGRLETNSSFGSASSGPVMSNLPPIRVRAEDRPPPPDRRYENIDDQFQKMNLGSGVKNAQPVTAAANPMISAVENLNQNSNSNRVGGFNDERPDTRRQQQALPQQMVNQQQKPPPPVEAPISDSRPVYYQERIPPLQTNPEPKREIPALDPATTYWMQQAPASGMQQVPVSGMQQGPVSGMQQVPASGMQQVPASGMQQVHVSGMQQVPGSVPVPESGYAMPNIPAPQQPQQPLQQQQQQQQQQQFIHANPQYVPVQTYYQVPHPVQQSQPFDPSVPMYYVSVRPNPQPVPAVSAVPLPKVASKPEVPPNLYRPVAPQPQMIHMAAPGAEQGYHVLHHHHPSQAPAPAQPMANYVYYTQTTTMPPSMPGQYQTVISDATQPTVEMNQNRAS